MNDKRTIWRQLRWRLVGVQMLVVMVGVVVLALVARFTVLYPLPDEVRRGLDSLAQSGEEALVEQVAVSLIANVRGDVLWALAIAAVAATIAGLIGSLLLMREILRPLQEITVSSRRIADGHYDERVAIPASDELAEVATHFNQMAAALEAVEQQRVILLGNVAHELRTPLTGLKGYLEGLMDGLFEGNCETFTQMYQELQRLQRLVDDIQSLSRVEAGQLDLNLQRFDLLPLIERTVGQIRLQAETGCLQIVADYPPAETIVYADSDRTAQVLLNLLSNAVRYTPEGGCITVRMDRTDHRVRVAVEDTGIGIPADALSHLFERFYRVDPSRTRSSGGSGVGLTIARHLVWAMGGELTAHSEGPGKGSTFTFTLPVVENTHYTSNNLEPAQGEPRDR